MTKPEVAAILKQSRRDAGLTQSEVAAHLGSRQQTVASWESGQSQPSIETFFALCRLYEISADARFGLSGHRELTTAGYRIGQLYDRAGNPDDRAVVDYALRKYAVRTKTPHSFTRELPLYHLPVSAGSGAFLDSDDYDLVKVGQTVPATSSFGVFIRGDSMEPDYRDGQIAWVKRAPSVECGQVGVFRLRGEGYIKRLERDGLHSRNPVYDVLPFPEDPEEFRVYGLVTAVTDPEVIDE